MNLVWAVVKGDLLTSACWALVYGVVLYVVARRQRASASQRALPGFSGFRTTPRWLREPETPESTYRRLSARRRGAQERRKGATRMLWVRVRHSNKAALRRWWAGVSEAAQDAFERRRGGGQPRGQA